MRVISGFLKGRVIKGYDIEGTRPTMDRVKMSLFGSIQDYIKDSVILDLFAGSGNLGIETISNGSKYCYFVDNNIKCIKCINDNINNFNIQDKCNVINGDYNMVLNKFKTNNQKFDIIFVDPPYKYKVINSIIDTINNYDLLNDNGILVLEYQYDTILDSYKNYKIIKNKKYGEKFILILKKQLTS